MSERKFLKCLCSQCGGHIEFPADGIGLTVPCPHCGWQTELMLAAPVQAPVPSSHSKKWVIAGAVIIVIGVVGVIGSLIAAQQLMKKSRAKRDSAVVVRSKRTNAPATARTETVPPPPTNNFDGFSATAVKIEKTPGSTVVHAVVTLKNLTDQQRFGVLVELDLLDRSGRKVGSAQDYKDIIEPRAQWTFHPLIVQANVVTAQIVAVHEK